MKYIKAAVALIVIGVVWIVVFLYSMLDEASGDSVESRTGRLTGEWPYRWLW